ncbi:MAG: bifunctional folylpolyglutamate synthase/dihydrofolate synthase [Pirellulales bacterium]
MRKRPQPRRAQGLTRDRVLAWLDGRINYERVTTSGSASAAFGVTRMRRLLEKLGNPHRRYGVVHVAGTKGKGSVVTMLAAILEEAGHRVGRYLSPHVHMLEERIAVDGRPIPGPDLVAALSRVIPAVEALDASEARRGRGGPTWFEVLTAAAFTHFADAEVDIAVIETGLGGRLDATNVCNPLASVITSISLDHMKFLGPTLSRIAAEKAGIIKRACPVVCGATHPAARRVIATIARRRRAPLTQYGRDFTVTVFPATVGKEPLSGCTFSLETRADDTANTRRYRIPLAGHHQAENAALAVVAAATVAERGVAVDERAVVRGLARATLPARIETVARGPLVVVDAAHNLASMEALASTLRPVLAKHPRRALVFAASADKQVERMLATVRGLFDEVVITRYLRNPRATPLARLRAACRAAGLPAPLEAESPRAALRAARSAVGPRGIVVVAGSFFLAAEVGAARPR